MPTYVYETIPKKAGKAPKQYEICQSMHDAPLSKHPETGEPIRRIIAGGIGVITHHARPEGCCGGHGGEGCHCQCGNA
jgi:predicted nucleic acid-binding Zn ribbon protein